MFLPYANKSQFSKKKKHIHSAFPPLLNFQAVTVSHVADNPSSATPALNGYPIALLMIIWQTLSTSYFFPV